MSTDHTSTIGAMAAGKLLGMATGERWIPAILILAGIILLRKRADARSLRHARHARHDGRAVSR
jgi:ADP-ribosylglycohydrolase